jgi:hypothetical protein
MRARGRTISVLGVVLASVLAACGGQETTAGEFDPGIPEDYIRNQVRADIVSNPAVAAQEPRDPEVECREETPNKTDPSDATRFRCRVRILAADGSELGTETWETLVQVDSVTGDSVVRDTRRIESSIDPAPQP